MIHDDSILRALSELQPLNPDPERSKRVRRQGVKTSRADASMPLSDERHDAGLWSPATLGVLAGVRARGNPRPVGLASASAALRGQAPGLKARARSAREPRERSETWLNCFSGAESNERACKGSGDEAPGVKIWSGRVDSNHRPLGPENGQRPLRSRATCTSLSTPPIGLVAPR